MSGFKLMGKGNGRMFRLIAMVLVLVMVIEMLPLTALASPFKDDAVSKEQDANLPRLEESLQEESPELTPLSYDHSSEELEQDALELEEVNPDEKSIGPPVELIVRLKETRGVLSSQSLGQDGVRVMDGSGPLQLVEVQGKSIDEAVSYLNSNPAVEYAEPNYLFCALAETPSDLLYDQQWGLHTIDAIWAWERANEILGEMKPRQVRVAVVDTGVDSNHQDLQGRVVSGWNFISNNNNTQDDSINGHGTHIAGIIAANSNNEIGVSGVSGEFPVNVVPVKALDAYGVGTMYDIARSIRWAVDEGKATIINLSLGAELFDFPHTLSEAVRYAQDKGALVIAAAGNNPKAEYPFYPASLPGVMSIGASSETHKRAEFSNWMYDILAPGENILSTLPSRVDEEQYGNMCGTSQACAFASGTAAFLWSVYPEKTVSDIKSALEEGLGYSRILNAYGALEELKSPVPDIYTLEFVSPFREDGPWWEEIRVTGTIDITVRVGSPSVVDRVHFLLHGEKDEFPLFHFQEGVTEGGYASISWDTTTVADGEYTVSVESYDREGEFLSSNRCLVLVANMQETGLTLEVKKPDGTPASRAWVTVHHVYVGSPNDDWPDEKVTIYEELWNDNADLSGRVMIPSSVAAGGNDYLVTARGTNPAFFYWKIVRAPNKVTLDTTNSSTVSVSALKTDGAPLAGAVVAAELLESNLPEALDPYAVVAFNEYDNEVNLLPLVTLDAQGNGTITMTPGQYNIRVMDETNRYYLFGYGQDVGGSTDSVELHPEIDDVTTLRFEPDEGYDAAQFSLEGISDPYFQRYPTLQPGQEITVSSGTYKGQIKIQYSSYNFTFLTPEIEEVGETQKLRAGGDLTGSLEPDYGQEHFYVGDYVFLSARFVDAYGNTLESVRYGSSARVPKFSFYSPDGDILHESINQQTGVWEVPVETLPGSYSAKATLSAGPLGTVETEFFEFQLEPPDAIPPDPPADLNVTVYRDGEPISDVVADLSSLVGESYLPIVCVYVDQEDEGGGKAKFGDLFEYYGLSQGDKVSIIAYGDASKGGDQVFLIKTITLEEPPMTLRMDADNLRKVRLVARDKEGNELEDISFSVYGFDPEGIAVGLNLSPEYIIGGSTEIWLPEGQYVVHARLPRLAWNSTVSELYYLKKEFSITTDTPYELQVELESSDAAVFSASGAMPVGDDDSNDYWAAAVSLFPESFHQSGVFDLGPYWIDDDWRPAEIYVTPASYYLEGVLIRHHSDGDWCYWLSKDEPVTLEPGESYVWYLDSSFDVEETTFSTRKSSYEIDDTVKADVHIEDGKGNRLVGMGLNMNIGGHGGASSCSSLRVPGGGQILIPTNFLKDEAEDRREDDIVIQNHEEIAPFIIISDPDGNEVCRYKNAGDNYGYLTRWESGSDYYDYRDIQKLTDDSTFFTGEYLIPKDALGGEYTAVMELETGPEGAIRRTANFHVVAVHASPKLNNLPLFTNAQVLQITGQTIPGAKVNLYCSVNGAEEVLVGTAVAGEDREFSIQVSLPQEGTYSFRATSTVDNFTSDYSTLVFVIVDRTKPGAPQNLVATPLDAAHVSLTWTAPENEDLSTIAFYRITRDGVIVANEVTPEESLQWQDSNLQALTEYTYEVMAVDRAGNQGYPATVTVTTLAEMDSIRPTPPKNLQYTLSKFRVSLSWESASDNIGVEGYRVYRTVKGDDDPSKAVVWDIKDPSAISFEEPDHLDASTTYVYTVVAYDASGNESITQDTDVNGIPAAVVEILTPDLVISYVRWSSPRTENGLLKSGDSEDDLSLLEITLGGDENRHGKATVILAGPYVDLADSEERNDGIYEIDLVEDKDDKGQGMGVYRGSMQIPLHTSQIIAITCSLEDGSGHLVTEEGPRLPDSFSPKLAVTIESEKPDSKSLKDAELRMWSESLDTGSRILVNGVGTYIFDNLPPAVDYTLTLSTKYKQVMCEEKNVVLNGGEQRNLTVNPRLPSTLRIRVIGDGEGLTGTQVSVSHAGGGPLAQGTTMYNGWASLVYTDKDALFMGSQIVVSVSVSSNLATRYSSVAGVSFVLGADDNEFIVTLPKRQKATLYGRITTEQDSSVGLGSVTISAYQILDGYEKFVVSSRTDVDGNYSISVLEGPVRLVLNHRWTGSREFLLEDPLDPNENRQHNIELAVSKAITLNIYTRKFGEIEYAMDMDWRVAVHLHASAVNMGTPHNPKHVAYQIRGIDGYLLGIYNAEPGDVIRVTADGYECGMGTDTVEVTLDENCWARAELHLVEKGTIKAAVRDTGGNIHDGLVRYAELYKIEENGPKFIETLRSNGEVITSKPLDEGTYSLIFHWDPLPSVMNAGGMWVSPVENMEYLKTYLGEDGFVVENVTLTDDPTLDLGIIRLPLPQQASSGYFRGIEGNELVPSKYESGPGGIITMNGRYRYEGSTRLYSPKICFGIPYGAQLVEDSVVVTTDEGLAEPQTEIWPDGVKLSFGKQVSGPFSGKVVYRVKMPNDPDRAVCEARMWAEYKTSGQNTVEDIMTVSINVPYVSIVAPPKAWDESREVEVSGKATPFSTVRVYDGSYFLAEARATESGTWKTTVVLPDRGRRANHYLRAEVILAVSDGDQVGPRWPHGSVLSVSGLKSQAVTLTWPRAEDESGVIQYVVTGYLEDGSVGTARAVFSSSDSGEHIQLTVEDLLPNTNYAFKVEAADSSYNWSSPLTADVKTASPDEEPPRWPDGTRLTASEVKFTSLRLSWPDATDNEGLKEYRVSCSPPTGDLTKPKTLPVDTTSLLVERLVRGREYVFTVEAIDINGNAAELGTSVTTLQNDTQAPVWPQEAKLTCTALDTEVVLSWPSALDNVEISRYRIYRGELNGNWRTVAHGYGNSHTLKQLTPETKYIYKVEALDSSGNPTLSALEATVVTAPRDRTPPVWDIGAQVTVEDKTQDGFLLKWPTPYDDSGVRSYKVWFFDEDLGMDMVRSTSGNQLRFTGLSRGETYSYTVLAEDTRGNWTSQGLTVSVKVQPDDETPPSWPSGSKLQIPEVGLYNAEVIWTPAEFDIEQPGLPSYLIQAKDVEGRVVWGTTVGQNINEWTVGQLQPGNSYTITVEAIDEWGNVSQNGPSADIQTPLVDTQAPRWPDDARLSCYGMNRATDGTYSPLFQWPMAKDFELHIYELTARDSQGQPAPSSPTLTMQTSWHMWGLRPAETYTVEVRAKDLSGNVSTALVTTVVTPGGLSGASLSSFTPGSKDRQFTAQSDENLFRSVSSVPAKIEYDQDAVRIQSVTMQQVDGRKVTFAPVGRFPYVLVPGLGFDFDIEFNQPERVSEMRIIAGNGAVLGGPLSGTPSPDAMVAVAGHLSGSTSIPGKLYASYSTVPKAFSLDDLPKFNAAVMASSMTNPWRDASWSKCEVSYDSEEQDSGNASIEAQLSDPRMHVDMNYSFSQVYDQTAGDPVWSFSVVSDKKAQFSGSVVIDSTQISDRMSAQGWLDAPKVLVRIAGQTWVEGGLNIYDLFSTVSGMHDQQNYEMDLDDLLNGLNPDCPAGDLNRYKELVAMEKKASKERTVGKCVLSLGSMALGIAIPGVGFAVGAFIAGQVMEHIIDQEQVDRFNDIKNDIEMNDFCKPKKREWKKDLIADPTWILDPAGYVYEVTPENRIEGVTTTALQKVGSAWIPWDATWYEQENPLLTDSEGRYAWDVPEGLWKVSFEKEGYEPTESMEMEVPPPHTDVNVSMVSTQHPAVREVDASLAGEGLELVFDKFMRRSTVSSGTVTVTELDDQGNVLLDNAGGPVFVTGTIEPVESITDPNDDQVVLAQVFRFIADTPLTIGTKYMVTVSKMVESYSGLSLPKDYVTTVTPTTVVPVTGVSLNKHSVQMTIGLTTRLIASVMPNEATNKMVSWSSSDPKVALVDQDGIVKAVSYGTAVITVTTNDGGHEDTCIVTVKSSSGNDPGPSRPSTQTPEELVDAEETYNVGAQEMTIEALGGIVILEIPQGTFSPGAQLVIRRLNATQTSLDTSFKRLSPTYEFLVRGGSKLNRPITVRFKYCSLCLMGLDPRKAAVYRESGMENGNYFYVGGIVDVTGSWVTVELTDFSRYAVLGRDITFQDIVNHWGRTEIEVLAAREMVSGIGEGLFQPDRLITRAELAKMLVGMLSQDPGIEIPEASSLQPTFIDVNPGDWFYSVVETASRLGLVTGDEGYFRPNHPVTRQELAAMLSRSLGSEYELPEDARGPLPFTDSKDISAWAMDSVRAVWYWGLMHGVGDNAFQPQGNATRAQAATVVLRMLEYRGLIAKHRTVEGNVTVSFVEGKHFELRDSEGKTYVLLPQNRIAENDLEEAAHRAASSVSVTGLLSNEPSIYMRGQIIKVFAVEQER